MLSVRLARTGIAHDIVVAADTGGERRLTLAIPGSEALPVPPVLDAAAVAALPLAMRAGVPLHVAGPLSAGAMQGLAELAAAWSSGGR